jgi:ATP-dependent Lon protease
MNKNNLKDLILIQNRFRYLNSHLKSLNKQHHVLKKCLSMMSENLLFLNNKNFFDNLNYNYDVILDELKNIKKKIDLLPDEISFRLLKDHSLSDLSFDICELNMSILKYMNHIAPNNLFMIFDLFVGTDKLYDNISRNDIDMLDLLLTIFRPISVWDSLHHKQKVEYDIPKNNKITKMSKEMIESLFNNKNGNVSSIIIGESSLPHFLKNLTEIVITDSNKNEKVNHFSYIETLSLFDNFSDNIRITRNHNTNTLYEDINGLVVYIRLDDRILVIQGVLDDDILDINRKNNLISELLRNIKKYINYEIITVPKGFKSKFIDTLTIRDILVCSSNELGIILKKKYNEYKQLKGKHLSSLINEFLLASKNRKVEILSTLLLGIETDNKLAFVLFEILKMKDKKGIADDIYNSLHYNHKKYLSSIKNVMTAEEEKILKMSVSDIPYERRINLMNTGDDVKSKAIEKLKSLKSNFQGDNKAQSWLDGLLEIPFGIYKENNIMKFKKELISKLNKDLFSVDQVNNYIKENKDSVEENVIQEWENYKVDAKNYLLNVRESLDEAVYGHKEAKKQLERIFAQWINGESKGAILGLHGPPGTGKTSLVKKGLSKCLMDNDNEPRPFVFLPIGGSVNGSTLVGHNYTYVGSTWGRIADSLMTSKCMNPIIFIDEVDKISNTDYGKEIVSILTHLTDSTQNDSFEDKYFSGVPLDLSKALIVFSYNDITLLDPILRDRITTIDVNSYTIEEKVKIIKDYMLPEILNDVGFYNDELLFSDEIIEFLINTYTNEAGVRKIKEKLVEIVRDINLRKINSDEFNIPYTITNKYIEELFENKPKMRIKKIKNSPEVGLVNGLYATTTGVGGLTVIQVMKYPSDKMLELSLTGQQGDVMKESCEYAKRIAYNLLSESEKEKILKDTNDKKCFGIHIHTPEAATKKDGPSAGAAMTLAIYSVLTGKKVNNEVAMTGEIDLCKNVTAIGGVYAKLNGAKKAGVKKALIPKENLEDLEILRKEGHSPEDENFEVVTIETIEDVFKHCLV